MIEMKTLTIGGNTYEIVDEKARNSIPTKTSDLVNNSGFITAKDIPEGGNVDLTDYYTKKEIDDKGFITVEDLPDVDVSEIPEAPKGEGAYELHVHIIGDKKIYYWEVSESTRKFFKYFPTEQSILSPNDMFTCDNIAALSAQDCAFYKGLMYSSSNKGIVSVIEPKNWQVIATYEHDKIDLLKPHANSVSIVETSGVPYMYSNIYNNYANEENKHIGECCVYRTYDFLTNVIWELGSLSSETGAVSFNENRQVTDFLDVEPLAIFSVTNTTNARYLISCYDKDKKYLGQLSTDQTSLIVNSGQWHTVGTEIKMANLKTINENISYIRLCVNGGVDTIPKLTVSYADNVSDTMVQILKIGFTDNADLWTVTDTRPYGNFIADGENGFLYVCVTDNDTNATKWHKFNLPSVDEGIYDSNYDS